MAILSETSRSSPMEPSDRYDAAVGEIGFVVRRPPNREWAIVDLVNRRYHILAYAASGQAEYACGGETFEVTKGHMLFFPKGLPHSGRSDPRAPWSFFSTTFDLHCASPQVEAAFKALPHRVAMVNTLEVQGLFSELERRWVSREPGYLLRCRSLILRMLHDYVACCEAAGPAVPHARKLAPIVSLLQSHHARTFSIEELAAKAELSPSRFRVLFRQYTGHSVIRYQNWLRINRARDLLLSGEYTVTEAAKEVGFLDVYYFSRLFKKLTGLTPSHYRNQ